jgi:Tfp pilus assembly protein PilX
MAKATRRPEGFTLVAALLVLMLLSGIAAGLMMLANGETKMGGNNLEDSRAYYGAESGMEKLTAALSALYATKASPTTADLNTLATTAIPSPAEIPNMTFQDNVSWAQVDGAGNPVTNWNVISAGPNAGLMAETIRLNLQVSAFRPSNASAKINRGVEVALIPVFQFGVFSDSDLSYFAGPPFEFEGRVHTNGNLFLAADSGPLVLDSKVTAVGEIIRTRLANGWTGGGYQGDTWVPVASNGCPPPVATAIVSLQCQKFTMSSPDQESCTGGLPPALPGGFCTPNPNWPTISTTTFNGFIGNAKSTNVKPLNLPFVNGAAAGAAQSQIVRKPVPGDPFNVATSREFNKAEIRILLAETQAELHPPGLNPTVPDANDVWLDGVNAAGGINVTSPAPAPGVSYLATADKVNTGDLNLIPPRCGLILPGQACGAPPAGTWPLIRGWLRVEYLNNAGVYVGVTREWLGLGFAKDPTVNRTAPGLDVTGHPRAILILQQLADRDGNGAIINGATAQGKENTARNGVVAGWANGANFYPINFFDPREGFSRDVALVGTSCNVNGIMNAVELDVGNLRQWLLGNFGASGPSGPLVNNTNQNGYILYFSDRRGQIPQGAPAATNGEYGFEDVINIATGGTPNGLAEPYVPGYNNNNGFSPEDVDQNGVLDNWGGANVGDGFNINTGAPAPINPYKATDCMNGGRQNWVSGARHVLKLVDAGFSAGTTNLPQIPGPGGTFTGGFTVASENPVYIQGDYNSSVADPFWAQTGAADIAHSNAAIIADAVTFLSNAWTDLNDMKNPNVMTNRNSANTYYRMAIAAGKNMNFPQTAAKDFGTDGGVHNFLRYVEDWSGTTLSYRGSIVSLYYAQYATGIYKCCTTVYNPPSRNYYFDSAFLVPANLPPGTPEFQDVVNLSYWQDFSPY